MQVHVTFQKIRSRYIRHPTGMDVFNEDLFWSNSYDDHVGSRINKILSVNKFLANDSQPTEIVSKLHDMASELHIFHAAVQMQGQLRTSV